jgi:glutaredoxin
MFRINTLRRTIVALIFLPLLAQAQDFSGILRNTVGRVFGDTVNGALRSITTASVGTVAQGVQRPADTAGQVILYRNASCGYCKRAAAYMSSRGIPFSERDINTNSAWMGEYRAYGGNGGVPLLVFGRETMMGFSEAAFDQRYARMQQEVAPSRPAQTPLASPAPSVPPAPAAALRQPQAGEALQARLKQVPVLAEPSASAAQVGRFGGSEAAIYLGEEHQGYYRVAVDQGEGWVNKLLVRGLEQ